MPQISVRPGPAVGLAMVTGNDLLLGSWSVLKLSLAAHELGEESASDLIWWMFTAATMPPSYAVSELHAFYHQTQHYTRTGTRGTSSKIEHNRHATRNLEAAINLNTTVLDVDVMANDLVRQKAGSRFIYVLDLHVTTINTAIFVHSDVTTASGFGLIKARS